MSQDSIRTYANLSKLFGNPVSIESYNKDFSDALSYTPDKKKTGIVIHVLNKDPQTENAPANANKKLNEYYIASDTIIWASSIANSPNATTDHIGISFQGYANCSIFAVIGLSDKSLPGLFLRLAFLSATLPLLLKRYSKELIMPQSIHPGKINADETLNTLIRRLRPLVEENSNLKITTDRGRAYALEIKKSDHL